MLEGKETVQKGGQKFGVFGGVGPVLGGSAGGKDYSIGSMLHNTTLNTQGNKDAQAKSRGDKLGGPVMSSRTQDMLEGTGLLPGGETGFRKGAKTSLNEAREGQGADVSKADEDTRGFAAEGAHPESGSAAKGIGEGIKPQPIGKSGGPSACADDGAAGWSAEGAKGGLAAKTGKETAAFTREEKDLLRGQGLMSLMSEEGTPTSGPTHDVAAGQYTGAFGAPAQETKSDNPVPAEGAKTGKEIDEDTMLHGQGVLSKQAGDAPAAARAPTGLGQDDIITSGNSFYGDATPQKDKKGFGSGAEKQGSEPLLSGSGRLAEKEVDLLHGQGVISKQTSDGRAASAPVGLGKDSILTSGNPQETHKAGAAEEKDELREEQSEIPDEEFGEQPSAIDSVWDAAGKVADKARNLIRGGTAEE